MKLFTTLIVLYLIIRAIFGIINAIKKDDKKWRRIIRAKKRVKRKKKKRYN